MDNIKGKVVAIMNNNIDTDILIPKQYLKSVKKTGFGKFVFAPWRYDEQGKEIESFVLNQDFFKDASILVTGENFGCGSSREHAAWALQDYGFKVIIAGGYSDIFYNNWLNNGHLPIILPEEKRKLIEKQTGKEIEIDLQNQKIIFENEVIYFDFPQDWKERILKGYDSIDYTLQYASNIDEYENR